MQLQNESNPALNTVTAYGHDYIEINQVAYHHAVHFGPEGDIHAWAIASAADITTAALRLAAGLGQPEKHDPMAFLNDAPPTRPADAPEVMLVGTGLTQTLLPAHIIAPLHRLGIGVEAMTTEAAARTYNILMAEGRRVVAALLPNKELP